AIERVEVVPADRGQVVVVAILPDRVEPAGIAAALAGHAPELATAPANLVLAGTAAVVDIDAHPADALVVPAAATERQDQGTGGGSVGSHQEEAGGEQESLQRRVVCPHN